VLDALIVSMLDRIRARRTRPKSIARSHLSRSGGGDCAARRALGVAPRRPFDGAGGARARVRRVNAGQRLGRRDGGEAGLGKTALVEQFLEDAAAGRRV
jgi:hypothetical protein